MSPSIVPSNVFLRVRPFGFVAVMLAILGMFSVSSPLHAGKADQLLPPALPWQAAEGIAMDPDSDDPWITPSEKSGLLETPTYDETVAWLNRLVEASPLLEMVSLGKSGEGRELWMVIASSDGAFSAETLRATEKPVVLVQGGIHSGEIDGKDAGLMLLRDITVKGKHKDLLDGVQWLFVPIFNVDGHERRSPHGRVNQRGPEQMGWRTNGRNLNLNRDFAKADAPVMQAMIRALNDYEPDLYVDVHVTDGIDYQYDITWGYTGRYMHSPSTNEWLETVLDPPVYAHLEAQGHVPGYLVFATDNNNPDSLIKWSSSSPRYSDGYGGARHLPTLLVENHSLKPYPQRVLGTYFLIEGILRTVGQKGDGLKAAIAADRARRPKEVALTWGLDPDKEPEKLDFKGVKWERQYSEAAGTELVRWTGESVDMVVERRDFDKAGKTVALPAAWWIPAPWSDVIERLRIHGVQMETLKEAQQIELDFYRLQDPSLARAPFEGHVRLSLAKDGEAYTVERKTMTLSVGSVRIPSDQDLGILAALLLEPHSEDAFLQWGFFNEILSRTEYIEGYVIGPMADRMLKEDPELAKRFKEALAADEEFAASPFRRLSWFYHQTPYYDERHLLYPVGREPLPAK